jgi:hypothetical protein
MFGDEANKGVQLLLLLGMTRKILSLATLLALTEISLKLLGQSGS